MGLIWHYDSLTQNCKSTVVLMISSYKIIKKLWLIFDYEEENYNKSVAFLILFAN